MVKVIGIGFEPHHYEAFREGNYFNGKIYLANKRDLYRAAGYRRLGCLQCWGMCGLCCSKKAWSYLWKLRNEKLDWDVKGDGFQMGGVMLIRNDGTLLMNHEQKGFSDVPDIEELTRVIDQNIGVGKTSEGESKKTK